MLIPPLAATTPADGRAPFGPPSPERYVDIVWIGGGAEARPVVDEGQLYQVIGRRGKLQIRFDRERMRAEWPLDTRAELSLRAYVSRAEGVEKEIEVDGYSTIGDDRRTVHLDLGAARGVVQQMFQGARYAHRIAEHADRAEIDGLKAKMDGNRERVSLQDAVVADVERTLGEIYNEAFAFQLDERDVREAARAIAAARARLDELEDLSQVAAEKEVEEFWSEIALERAGIEAWLEGLLAPSNRSYLPIVASVVGRQEEIIVGVAQDIRGLLSKHPQGGLTPEGAEALIEKWESERGAGGGEERDSGADAAGVVGDGEGVDPDCVGAFECRASPEEVFRDHPGCWREPAEPPDLEVQSAPKGWATERAEERVSVIEGRLRDLVTDHRFETEVEDRALDRFRKEAEAALAAREKTIEQLEEEAEKIRKKEVEFVADHGWRQECRKLTEAGDRLEVTLTVAVMHRLLQQIPDAELSLDEHALEPGDQMAVAVSFQQPTIDGEPPAGETYRFDVAPWGWDGPSPDVREVLTFAEGEDQDGFDPAAGTAALWHWYGRSPKRPSAKRTFAPGFGIAAQVLESDDEDSSIEFGLGPVVSLFNDTVHLTYGWTLSAEGTPSYFGAGVSFSAIVDKFEPKEEQE